MDGHRYFIEPVTGHIPNDQGQHLHVVYKNAYPGDHEHRWGYRCGTTGNWEEAWRERFRDKFTRAWDSSDSKSDECVRDSIDRRGLTSVHRYLETLVVADKKFMEYHKNSDYETYILTIMNMVSLNELSYLYCDWSFRTVPVNI